MELKPIVEYETHICSVLNKLNSSNAEQLAHAFSQFDVTQTETIDKSDLAVCLAAAGIKISVKKARELSITLETRLHGEVGLDELSSLCESLKKGSIDMKLLKQADHQLPRGHINIGQMVPQNQHKLKSDTPSNVSELSLKLFNSKSFN